ncbi:MAG: SUF system NifU family Fe-S cluster assembly protein [Saprospiraceae bacterium]|nr:SUF system NifU family Fe-S cluster assembly protein [Saprospiraceae bacterium]
MERQLTDLYDDTILAHNKTPVSYEKRLTAQHIVEAYNPLCGDKFKLFFDIADGQIQQISFHGYGCAVSKAATSVLVKRLEGLTMGDAWADVTNYLKKLTTETAEMMQLNDAELRSFEIVRQFPERLACATLSWEAMNNFFINVEKK